MNYEIEVIGDSAFVIGFSLSGVKGRTIEGKNLIKYINDLIKDKAKKVIILQDKYYEQLPDRLKNKISLSITPLIIVLGDQKSDDIKFMIKKVFGVELL
jgi:vacuolar-type H+-ATPase subunit F/Vma7